MADITIKDLSAFEAHEVINLSEIITFDADNNDETFRATNWHIGALLFLLNSFCVVIESGAAVLIDGDTKKLQETLRSCADRIEEITAQNNRIKAVSTENAANCDSFKTSR